MDFKISIAIINWNTKYLLKECLNSIYSDNSECMRDVTVVDNASSDGSVELVKKEFPKVRLIANQSNVGYAKAANQAILLTREQYILVLNSDTKIFAGALDSLLTFAIENPRVGALGPRLVNSDGSLQLSCRKFPSFTTGVGHAFLSLFFPNNPYTKRYQLTDWNHANATEVDWISGAAMFLKRDAVCQIGLFDEAYFMYVEDLDLCYRLWQANWKVYYQPMAVVMHHVAQSSAIKSPHMIMEHHRSVYRFMVKRNRGYKRILNLPIGAGLLLRGSILAVVCLMRDSLRR